MATIAEVEAFLREVRLKVGLGRCQLWSRDRHTVTALAADGLLFQDIWPTVQKLATSDYSGGPEPDDNPARGGQVWIFGPTLRGIPLYVKLKATDAGNLECLSFHAATAPLPHPLP